MPDDAPAWLGRSVRLSVVACLLPTNMSDYTLKIKVNKFKKKRSLILSVVRQIRKLYMEKRILHFLFTCDESVIMIWEIRDINTWIRCVRREDCSIVVSYNL